MNNRNQQTVRATALAEASAPTYLNDSRLRNLKPWENPKEMDAHRRRLPA
jgi:hypothetical protein